MPSTDRVISVRHEVSSSGGLGCWSTGVLQYWGVGVLELECWSTLKPTIGLYSGS
jgi:hypothetical protein